MIDELGEQRDLWLACELVFTELTSQSGEWMWRLLGQTGRLWTRVRRNSSGLQLYDSEQCKETDSSWCVQQYASDGLELWQLSKADSQQSETTRDSEGKQRVCRTTWFGRGEMANVLCWKSVVRHSVLLWTRSMVKELKMDTSVQAGASVALREY